jgi:hypothetical protein
MIYLEDTIGIIRSLGSHSADNEYAIGMQFFALVAIGLRNS